MPMHDRAPTPKGWNAVLAAGESASAVQPSLEEIQRCGSKLRCT
jgi:hypothetical protein